LKLFLENEYAVDVIIPTQIKPLPSFPPMKNVLIVEEAPTAHGWGAEVAAQLAATQFYTLEAPIARLGADAHPIPASKSLETASLPQIETIFQFFT
ncbi:MAG: hypothetical protein KDK65_07875, partial [Chlamydiia bacterium]|nr:hypothetical protein [Chlamydiia bacterium]